MLPFEPAAAVDIVREAARLAMELQGQCRVEIKPDNTFVTEADRRLEAFLKERLNALAPGLSYLGEETGLTGDPDAPAWVIDPIDGTNNFVRDVPLWSISIGLVEKGRSIMGVVAVPPQNEIYWAVEGQGSWREQGGQRYRLEALDRDSLMHEDLIACNTEAERAVEFRDVKGAMRNFGSVAYHLVLLARGSLCATLSRWHQLYDVAGGMCICSEAGCEAIYLDGRSWVADLTGGKSSVPLLVAPPQALKLLSESLILR